MILSLDNVALIATFIGTLPVLVAVITFMQLRTRGRASAVIPEDLKSYANSLISRLEERNRESQWTNSLYSDPRPEKAPVFVTPEFYLVTQSNRVANTQEYQDLSISVALEGSHGTNHKSLQRAIKAARAKTIVIVGEPGSGKSVSLRLSAIQAARDFLSGKTSLLPVYIELGAYVKTDLEDDGSRRVQKFRDFLREVGEGTFLSTVLGSDQLLQAGRLRFFLDALDELPRQDADAKARLKEINSFVGGWRDNEFIFTSRSLDYNRDLGFREILLKPFDDRRISEYLELALGRKAGRELYSRLLAERRAHDLCHDPFYLFLISRYFLAVHSVTENRAQLIQSFEDSIWEQTKTETPGQISKWAWDNHLISLAHYVSARSTAVVLDEYRDSPYVGNRSQFDQVLELASERGLLEVGPPKAQSGRWVRFGHRRLLEYFTAKKFVALLESDPLQLPAHLFSNLWWRETVLLMSGVMALPDRVAERAMEAAHGFRHVDAEITRIVTLNMELLALECLNAGSVPADQQFTVRVRSSLMERARLGDPLSKVAVIRAIAKDTLGDAHDFLQSLARDPSNWVAETAFLALTGREFRVRPDLFGVLKEYWHFFLRGRLFQMAIPVFKHARLSRSFAISVPFFLVLAVVNLGAIALLGYVASYVINFLLFHLDYGFTTNCFLCLGASAIMLGAMVYFVLYGDHSWPRNAVDTVPAGFLLINFFLSADESYGAVVLARIIGLLAGVSAIGLFGLLRRGLEDWSPLQTVTVGLLGANVPILLMLDDVVLLDVLGFSEVHPYAIFGSYGEEVSDAIERMTAGYFSSDTAIFIALAMLLGVLGVIGAKLFDEGRKIRRVTQLSRAIRDAYEPEESMLANRVGQTMSEVRFPWGRRVLLQAMLERIGDDIHARVRLLHKLATYPLPHDVRDDIYQFIENDERALRRAL